MNEGHMGECTFWKESSLVYILQYVNSGHGLT